MQVIDFFDRGAALAPDQLLLRDDSGAVRTYAQTQRFTHRFARSLLESHIGTQPKVAVYSPNCAVAYEAILGLHRAGATWVPVNARNAHGENAHILRNFDVDALFFHSAFEAQVRALRQDCPGLKLCVCLDGDSDQGPSLSQWLGEDDTTVPALSDDPSRLIAIFSTGGTTGVPKGVMWPARLFETMTANFFASMPVRKRPVHLVAAPLTHGAGGFALMLNAAGATHIVMSQVDPLRIMQAIQEHRVTHLFLPPTVIYMMLAHPRVREFDYTSLEHFIYAAAPMSRDKLQEAMSVFGPVMTQVFGQVEAPIMCTYLGPAEHFASDGAPHPTRLSSCGRPTLLTPVEIMDEGGRLMPAGQRGEIVVRGNMVMLGYYKNPEATAKAHEFGWHHTGDVGYKDDEGYLYIVDRKRDLIISGGFNIFPGEVEQAIWSHPAVQDCAVIGVPDDKWGEAVKAVVELKPGAAATEEELIELCKKQLGGIKAPKSVEFWPTLPRTAVGKVRKADIRARYWANRDRAI